MKIKVKILETEKVVELKQGSTVRDLFKKIKENSETYIVKRGKQIIIDEEKLKDKDKVELIKIVSGG